MTGRPRLVTLLGPDGTPITSTPVAGGKEALDVNVAGGNVTFTASNAVNYALSFDNYNLAAAAFNQTSAITGDYLLDHIEVKFNSVEERTITVTSAATGGTLFSYSGPRANVEFSFDNKAYKNGSQITVTVTQTTGACLMNLRLVTFIGTDALAPVTTTVNQGNAGSQAWPVQIGTAGPNTVSNPVRIGSGFVNDANNSFSGSLAASASTPSSPTDVSGYTQITCNIYFTPDISNGATFTFRFSPDGTNWYTSVPSQIPNGNIVIPVPLRVGVWKFFEAFVTNGSTPVTCQLSTNLHLDDPGLLTRTGSQTVQPGDPTTLVRALIEPSFKGHLSILGADRSIGGEAITLPYIIQDVWEFNVPFTNNNIATAVSGGATAVQSVANGLVLTLPDSATASIAQVQGQKKIRYKSGREFREEFSAGFMAAGVAGVNELYGLTDAITPAANFDGPSVTYAATTLTDLSANFSAATGVTVGQTITAGAAGASTATITAVTSTTVLTFSGGWTGGTPTNFTPYVVNPKTVDPTTTGNGLLLGWVGTTFGFHIVSGGTITSYDKGTWASAQGRQLVSGGELLDGSGLSPFRQGGAPVAWLLNNGNAFRIRGVWFGVGPVYVDIKSPDDAWVPAFFFRYPNTATVPYIQSPNMFLFAGVSKSAVTSTSYKLFSFCANGGTVEVAEGFEPHEINGHKLIQRAASGLTSTPQLMHTVAGGRQFLVNSLFTSVVFANSNSRLEIRDGGSSGALRFALQGGQANTLTNEGPAFPTPLQFFTDVTVVLVGGGTITWSGGMSGYEKEV